MRNRFITVQTRVNNDLATKNSQPRSTTSPIGVGTFNENSVPTWINENELSRETPVTINPITGTISNVGPPVLPTDAARLQDIFSGAIIASGGPVIANSIPVWTSDNIITRDSTVLIDRDNNVSNVNALHANALQANSLSIASGSLSTSNENGFSLNNASINNLGEPSTLNSAARFGDVINASISGDVIGTLNNTLINTIAGISAVNIAASVHTVNYATNLNNPATLVLRDQKGNFSAGTVTANLTGTASGNITSITAGRGLKGGLITKAGTISLTDTEVIPGTYTLANITVDQNGRITEASSGDKVSIGINVPVEFNTSNNPVSNNGILQVTKAQQVSNTVWAGPTNGKDAPPTFRALTEADLPCPINTTNGGTGLISYNIGDLLYAQSPTSLTKLAISDNGKVLTSQGNVPMWSSTIAPSCTLTLGLVGQTTMLQGNISACKYGQTINLSPQSGTVYLNPGTLTIYPITAGTINNTSIGSTAASSGTFTQLTVNGPNLNTNISPTGTGTVTISPASTLTLGTAGQSIVMNGQVSYSTSPTITAGTDNQGQCVLTSDYNIVTTCPNNPSGVTLPIATMGRKIVIINAGTNPLSVYPNAVPGNVTIDFLTANSPTSVGIKSVIEFIAASATRWYTF